VTKEKHNENPTKAVFGIDGPKSLYFEGKKMKSPYLDKMF